MSSAEGQCSNMVVSPVCFTFQSIVVLWCNQYPMSTAAINFDDLTMLLTLTNTDTAEQFSFKTQECNPGQIVVLVK